MYEKNSVSDNAKSEKKVENNQPKYSKEQAMKSKIFEKNRDALAVILDDKKSYTKVEIQTALKNFYEREVS